MWGGDDNSNGLLVFAFVVGIVPQAALNRLRELWQIGLRGSDSIASAAARARPPSATGNGHANESANVDRDVAAALADPLPLTDLEGIDLYDRTRLGSEGVTNIEALAHHDLIDLMLATRIPVPRLVDWTDQAILRLHVSTEDLKILRRYGIRTASDLEYAESRAEDKPIFHSILDGESTGLPQSSASSSLRSKTRNGWGVFAPGTAILRGEPRPTSSHPHVLIAGLASRIGRKRLQLGNLPVNSRFQRCIRLQSSTPCGDRSVRSPYAHRTVVLHAVVPVVTAYASDLGEVDRESNLRRMAPGKAGRSTGRDFSADNLARVVCAHPRGRRHGSLPYTNAVLVLDVVSTHSVRPSCSMLKVSRRVAPIPRQSFRRRLRT